VNLSDYPAGHYGCLLADPAWPFRTYTRDDAIPQRAEQQHYPSMPLSEMAALPVGDRAAKDCALFMWAIGAMLPEAIELGRAWGFRYVTDAFYWLKQRLHDADQMDMFTGDIPQPVMGLGYWTRKQIEPCLLFTRGSPPRLAKGISQIIIAPRGVHSRKPSEQYDRIEALCGGPRLELFARNTRAPEWDSWGNEVGKLDDLG